jgi:hypothetical protein
MLGSPHDKGDREHEEDEVHRGQIVAVLQEAGTEGTAVRDVCSRHGVSEQTFYCWAVVILLAAC